MLKKIYFIFILLFLSLIVFLKTVYDTLLANQLKKIFNINHQTNDGLNYFFEYIKKIVDSNKENINWMNKYTELNNLFEQKKTEINNLNTEIVKKNKIIDKCSNVITIETHNFSLPQIIDEIKDYAIKNNINSLKTIKIDNELNDGEKKQIIQELKHHIFPYFYDKFSFGEDLVNNNNITSIYDFYKFIYLIIFELKVKIKL